VVKIAKGGVAGGVRAKGVSPKSHGELKAMVNVGKLVLQPNAFPPERLKSSVEGSSKRQAAGVWRTRKEGQVMDSETLAYYGGRKEKRCQGRGKKLVLSCEKVSFRSGCGIKGRGRIAMVGINFTVRGKSIGARVSGVSSCGEGGAILMQPLVVHIGGGLLGRGENG